MCSTNVSQCHFGDRRSPREAAKTAGCPSASHACSRIGAIGDWEEKKREQLAVVAAESAAGEPSNVVPEVSFEGSKKVEKVKTRHMMVALTQSLQKFLGFRWSDTLPSSPLRPLRAGEQHNQGWQEDGLLLLHREWESGMAIIPSTWL